MPTVDGKASKVCALVQEQHVTNTGQRVLMVELRPVGQGLEGALVLPFGLALAKGATLQVDDAAATAPLAFSTCLPVGCVVPVSFVANWVASLRKGNTLKIGVSGDGGAETPLSVSLKGFSASIDRAIALAK
jgi:invasion protein IalB